MNRNPIDHLYLDGIQYDLMYGSSDSNPSITFLLEQSEETGGPVLELACGTGELALPLAQHGLRITGIDRSSHMLREARRKSTEGNLTVEWFEADMRDFDLGRRFSLIVLLGNALAHLLTNSDLAACLGCVRSHLLPQGRFLLNGFMPNLSLLMQSPEERHSFAEFTDPSSGEPIEVTYANHYDPGSQINQVTTYYTYPGKPERVGGPLNLRMYFPQELDALLNYNGFRIDDKYGSFERKPFASEAKTQLFVCSLPGE